MSGQRCQSARHKHGDYLIMKAERCCSPGCELPARGSTGSPMQPHTRRQGMGWDGMGWDGMGWDGMGGQEGLARVIPVPEQKAEMAEGGKRAFQHPQPATDLSLWSGKTGRQAVGNHCSSRAAPGKLCHSSPGMMGSRSAFQGKGRAKRVGPSWTTLHGTHVSI